MTMSLIRGQKAEASDRSSNDSEGMNVQHGGYNQQGIGQPRMLCYNLTKPCT